MPFAFQIKTNYGPSICPHCGAEFTKASDNQVICRAYGCRQKQQAVRARRSAKKGHKVTPK